MRWIGSSQSEDHHLVPDTDDLGLQGRDLARIVVDHEGEGIALAGLGVENSRSRP